MHTSPESHQVMLPGVAVEQRPLEEGLGAEVARETHAENNQATLLWSQGFTKIALHPN